ncbi:MAG TPA: hypothetical protein PK609_03045 [Candidatus Paceibacterota bacterium]|nr:hypothetical protein [Candidatus Paceibacterota bacterium]
MAKKDPTARQLEALRNFNIVPPSTKAACSSLLTWISNGGDRSGERVAIIIETQSKFLDKRVQHHLGSTGRVRYVMWLGPGRLPPAQQGSQYTHPLDAMIDWDDRKPSHTSIGSLTPIN